MRYDSSTDAMPRLALLVWFYPAARGTASRDQHASYPGTRPIARDTPSAHAPPD
ncbi:hypothetical protein [Fontivita pretiosa]|uniref:hypothetical protein n=1 Tax=Fontivita pretiosa TaxID=2989684 RepID=UPI003D16A06C